MQSWAESPQFSKSGRPLSDYLEKCYCSFEVGIMKPEPAFFQYMLDDAQIKADETLFLDDSPANIEAAAAFGIQTMLVEKNGNWLPRIKQLVF